MDRNEAIEVLKKYQYDPEVREALECLHPELAESEDEMIRKGLIEHLKELKEQSVEGSHLKRPEHYDAWIAWLKKEGEKEYALKSFNEEDVYKFVQYIERQAKAYELNLPNRSYDIYGFAKDILSWLEKQGSQNLANSAKTCKAEPKFKVGDWIISDEAHEDYRICKITNVENGNYTIESIYGYKGYNTFETFEKSYHPWTIQNAKDGDILATDGFIFVFKEIREDKGIGYYCANEDDLHEGDDSTFHISAPNSLMGSINNNFTHYTPATEEQCDILMKAINDAGYTFDFDKKELKKIEQKHTPKHRVGDTIYYNSFGELKSMIVANVVTDSTDNLMYEDKEGNAVFEKDIIEQNPAWSEEDEKMRALTIYYIREYQLSNRCRTTVDEDMETSDACEEWLKSLKERHTWKPSNLPHWKKSTLPGVEDVTGFNSDYFSYKGYIINYKELFEKLLKDD